MDPQLNHGLGVVVVLLGGLHHSLNYLGKIPGVEQIFVKAAAVILVGVVFGLLGYYLFGRKPVVVDFMIATEGEMKKVNWSSKRELWTSTKAVILLTLFVALACWILDLGFARFFGWVCVLHEVS